MSVLQVRSTEAPFLSPALLKVVNDSPEGTKPLAGLAERHLIPFVPEIFRDIDRTARTAYIQPPKGLLKLGRQQLILDIICPRIREIASDGEQGKDQQIMCMPSRQTLEQMGEHRLVRGILSAGGFLYVAQQLGLRVSRRPNGYWDNIENLDEELSLLVAAHWVELQDDENTIYYYNAIMGRTQWIEPELPTKIPLDDEGTLLIAEDENDRVMPSRADLLSSGRYDLNNAIRYHGGYRAVAEALDRRPKWPRNVYTTDERELLRELRTIQLQLFGTTKQMPSKSQLCAFGRPELVQAINASGGFRAIAAKVKAVPRKKPIDYWRDPQAVIAELRNYFESNDCLTEPGWMPSSRELREAERGDLRYGLSIHGSRKIAEMMGLRVKGGRRKEGEPVNQQHVSLEKRTAS